MSNEIRIRKANHQDVALLCSLGIKTFRDTFEAVNTPEDMKLYLDKNFDPERVRKEIEEEGSVFFLAFDGDEGVGFARIRRGENQEGLNSQNALEIERIYSVKEHHGKQVAGADKRPPQLRQDEDHGVRRLTVQTGRCDQISA